MFVRICPYLPVQSRAESTLQLPFLNGLGHPVRGRGASSLARLTSSKPVFSAACGNALKLELGIDANSFFVGEELAALQSQFASGRSAVRGHFEMSRDIFVEIPDLLRQLSEAIEQEEIPEEVAREISNGIRETLAKLEDHRNLIDPYKPDELVAGLRKYMLTMRKKLGEHELLARGSRASRHRE